MSQNSREEHHTEGSERHGGTAMTRFGCGGSVHGECGDFADGPAFEFARPGEKHVAHDYDSSDCTPRESRTHQYAWSVALQVPPNCDLTLGLVCVDKSVPGTTVWRMRVDERFLNPAGVVQGGFISAMLDSAMGASAVSSLGARKALVANTEMKVSFLRPASPGDELTCTAQVLKSGSVIMFLEAKVFNQDQKIVATASSSYLIRERAE